MASSMAEASTKNWSQYANSTTAASQPFGRSRQSIGNLDGRSLMCGIGGFIGAYDTTVAEAMLAAMPHRGPDGTGIWSDVESGVHLVHRRLAIVDVATGQQPMWDESGEIGIVFNGEIYNHQALRRQLTALGHHFATDHSDTEVIIQGYKAWGSTVVDRLNGMWAFALLDRRQKQLLLSRDRFGEKPLYW